MGPETSQIHAPRPRTFAPSTRNDRPNRILVPVRYAAWLSGDIGATLARTVESSLASVGPVRVTRLPRALLIESDEAAGPLLEAVHRAVVELEKGVASSYPVLHHEMGPVWTGTLQAVFH